MPRARSSARSRALCSAALLGAAACASACESDPTPLTQIIVVVDSDLQMPAEIDNVSISVSGALDMPPAQASPTAASLPLTLGLVHSTGPLGPLTVTVQGTLAGRAVLEHAADVSFKAGKTLELKLPLQRACEELSTSCQANQTCSYGQCVTRTLDALPEFTGAGASTLTAGRASDAPADSGTASGNQAPVCTITAPADGSHFPVGEVVRFNGSCSDPDGTFVYPRWRSNLNGLLSVLDFAIEDHLMVGTHTITLCGYDLRDTSLSGCAMITVTIDAAQ